ncbi:hypothetical protein [uncultured Flavobacterium sp.]|jgi:propionyl-CoA synthetase
MRTIADRAGFRIPSTIDNEAIVGEIAQVLKKYKIRVDTKK